MIVSNIFINRYLLILLHIPTFVKLYLIGGYFLATHFSLITYVVWNEWAYHDSQKLRPLMISPVSSLNLDFLRAAKEIKRHFNITPHQVTITALTAFYTSSWFDLQVVWIIRSQSWISLLFSPLQSHQLCDAKPLTMWLTTPATMTQLQQCPWLFGMFHAHNYLYITMLIFEFS